MTKAPSDPVRDLVREAIARRGLDMATVSRQMGRNHAYIQQFLERGSPQTLGEEAREQLAPILGLKPAELRSAKRAASAEREPPNARIIGPVDLIGPGERIPVLGQAVGGSDGRFLFNGETMAEIFAPSQLWGVRNAYAVYVSGDSMEPRYFAGETIYVNPHMPARQGDFVVVQIIEDPEEPPTGYVKQFVSMTGDKLRLRQFNPAKDMTFDRARVMSVHKIVGSGI